MKKNLYLLVIEGDVEPRLEGPFKNDKGRLEYARQIRAHTDRDGVYRLNTDATGNPTVYPFSNSEIEG